MRPPLQYLESIFSEAASLAFPDHEDLPIDITPSTQEKYGHYQFNSAMKVSKQVKLSPREAAEIIAGLIPQSRDIESIEIAGPGFINVTLSSSYLNRYVKEMLLDSHLGVERPLKPEKIIVDFSSPNTAKEMHVGHLRSTIIGDSLARLFEFLGHEVLRLNHVGDWGTSFGMLIAYMKKQARQVLEGKETTNLTHLVAWYKTAKKMFDQDPAFKKESQMEVVALQRGDPDALAAWKLLCGISRKAYNEIYDLLGVEIVERGESYYNPLLADLIQDLEQKGLVEISHGAKCIFLEGFQNREGELLPLMIQKSDGGYNYDTTDMAAIRHRIEEEKADRIIYVTDAGQATHFQMVFTAAEKAGYLDPTRVRVDHVPFGLVLGPDGKKFRSRTGETEKLLDLLLAAIDNAEEILQDRSPEMLSEERKTLANALGIAAIKYSDLSSHRSSDYQFSYERMLRFEGNTAAYLMYSYVRVNGIKRKTGIDAVNFDLEEPILLKHPSEIALGIHLARFGEVLNAVAAQLLPHRLTEYLYNLAEKFNAFYRDCPVEGSKERNSRLQICEATSRAMKQGLYILGVETVDKM